MPATTSARRPSLMLGTHSMIGTDQMLIRLAPGPPSPGHQRSAEPGPRASRNAGNSLTDRGFWPIILAQFILYRLMTEPQRTDFNTPAPADADRATRIEELLVSGLDHYFAEDYEQAINVWTRVIFLDREHDRARAYIDRARKAIAERQRQSEELLHRGLDAYKSGDVENARDLLTRAVEQGAPSDEALVLLERMDRLEGTGFAAPVHRRT